LIDWSILNKNAATYGNEAGAHISNQADCWSSKGGGRKDRRSGNAELWTRGKRQEGA